MSRDISLLKMAVLARHFQWYMHHKVPGLSHASRQLSLGFFPTGCLRVLATISFCGEGRNPAALPRSFLTVF